MGSWETEHLRGLNPRVSERWLELPLGLWEASPLTPDETGGPRLCTAGAVNCLGSTPRLTRAC